MRTQPSSDASVEIGFMTRTERVPAVCVAKDRSPGTPFLIFEAASLPSLGNVSFGLDLAGDTSFSEAVALARQINAYARGIYALIFEEGGELGREEASVPSTRHR